MWHVLSTCAFIPSAILPVAAEAPTLSLTVILTPERVKAAKLGPLAPVLAVSNRGAMVVVESNRPFMVNGRRSLLDTPTPVSDCAFTSDGALLAVNGRKLGYCASGRFNPQVELPEDAMRLAIGQNRIYIYGGDNDQSASIYVMEPEWGHAKLCTVPSAIGAASAAGDTLYFSMANDIYRLTPGDEINLICHLPGPPITSIATAEKDILYFIAGRTLYTWQTGKVGLIGEGVGDVVRWQNHALYILDSEKQSLIKLENLPRLEGMPDQAP